MTNELLEDVQKLELQGHYKNPYGPVHGKVQYRKEAQF